MMYYEWFFLFLIVLSALCFTLIISRMGMRHYENMARIKNGYPTLDGATPHKSKKKAEHSEEEDVFERIQ